MATATFYNTSKRHNSTLVPSGGSDMEVVLKGGADLNAPLFLLSSGSIPNYSMMRFEGKYYFINKVRSVRNDLYELECSVDVLATYKANIQAMTPYVLYYTHNNTEISDGRLSTKTTATYASASGNFDTLGSTGGTNNAVILNVTGKDSCASYAVSQDIARTLLSDFSNWYEDPEISEPVPDSVFAEIVDGLYYFAKAIYKAVKQLLATGKADDSIRSAIMLPLPVSAIGGYEEQIVLGQYETGKNGYRVADRIFADGATVSIPWQASDWRRNAPYHEIFLYIPYVGLVSISPSDVQGLSSLTVSVVIDKTSGDSIFYVHDGSNTKVFGQYHTNLGASYAIGSSNVTPVQGATALASTVAGVAGSVLTGGLSTALSGASFLGLANAINGQPSTIGSNSGGAGLGISGGVKCFTIFHDTTVAPSSISDTAGTPANQVLSLSGVSGYVRTANASVSGSMTDDERQEINTLMNGGIYIE